MVSGEVIAAHCGSDLSNDFEVLKTYRVCYSLHIPLYKCMPKNSTPSKRENTIQSKKVSSEISQWRHHADVFLNLMKTGMKVCGYRKTYKESYYCENLRREESLAVEVLVGCFDKKNSVS